MRRTIINTKKDIKISKGTLIPMLTANDEPIGYDINIPSGAKLEERRGCTIATYDGDLCYTTPYMWAIFKFICDKAIEDGAEQIVTEDNKKVFNMFKLITHNRIVPEEGNWINDFEAETIEEAEILAGKYAEKYKIDFQYTVR